MSENPADEARYSVSAGAGLVRRDSACEKPSLSFMAGRLRWELLKGNQSGEKSRLLVARDFSGQRLRA